MNTSRGKLDQPAIVFGVCGIGNGHTNRQLPLINHFAERARMVIFSYDESYRYFSKKFQGKDSVKVIPVEVPYFVGNRNGLDFEATAKHPFNQNKNFDITNSLAMAKAQRFLGKPDLVVSDYEPNSARYAYAHNAPLVTLDQQSKYLWGEFPDFGEASCRDEIARLRMFFPKAAQRIATSFFNVKPKVQPDEQVDIFPAILKDEIISLRRHTGDEVNSLLLYLSSQEKLEQPLDEIVQTCESQTGTTTHIFAPAKLLKTSSTPVVKNVIIHQHGDPTFYTILSNCAGIISTAGHTLLSEAMHLNIPVYAIPFNGLYEQQMNAQIIAENNFGISHHAIDNKHLAEFVQGLNNFTTAIQADRHILLRGPSQQTIICHLEQNFLN